MIEFCCCKDSENMRRNEAQVKKVGQKPCDDEKSCTFAADISREFGTTIRQVRAEAYRFSTTVARILRQI